MRATQARIFTVLMAIAVVVGPASSVSAARALAASPVILHHGDILTTLNDDGSRRSTCTLGLVVKKESESADLGPQRWAITAGHCFDKDVIGEDVYTLRPEGGWNHIGLTYARKLEAHSLPGATGTEWDMSSLTAVLLDPEVTVRAQTSHGRVVSASDNYKYGQTSCHLGIASGWQCGRVAVASDKRGESVALSDPGDSGGPVFLVGEESPANPENTALTLIGIVVAKNTQRLGVRFNPWENLQKDITAAIGGGWKYYVSTD